MNNHPYDHPYDAPNGDRRARRSPRYPEGSAGRSPRSNPPHNPERRRNGSYAGAQPRSRAREDYRNEHMDSNDRYNERGSRAGSRDRYAGSAERSNPNDRYEGGGYRDPGSRRSSVYRDRYRQALGEDRDRYRPNPQRTPYRNDDVHPYRGDRGRSYDRRGAEDPRSRRRSSDSPVRDYDPGQRGRSRSAGGPRPNPANRRPRTPAKQVDQELGNFISRRITIVLITLLLLVAAISVVGRFIMSNQESGGTYVVDSAEKIATIAESSKLSEEEVISRLEGIGVESKWAEEAAILSQTDARFQKIAESSSTIGDEGPEVSNKLIKLAVSDPEAIDYVVNFAEKYPQDESQAYSESVKQGEAPVLYQWDERWGYLEYSSTAFGCTGCGPTCMSMVYMALTGENDMTPGDMAEYANANGFETETNGTINDFFPTAAAAFGFTCEEVDVNGDSLRAALDDGCIVICNVGSGDFTDDGHFIVITGFDDNGDLKVNDPFSSVNSSKAWDVDEVIVQTMALYAFK